MRSLWGRARRKKDSRDWYVGSTVCEARRTTLALDFLDAGRTYEATVYRDADTTSLETNPDAYVVERKNVRKGDSLTLDAVREREHCFMMSASPGTGSYTWLDCVWEFMNHKGYNASSETRSSTRTHRIRNMNGYD